MTTLENVLTEDFVRDGVLELVESDLVYRQIFDQIDATGISSNAYTYTVAEDKMGRVNVVPEGAEVPRHQSSVRQVTVTFDKFAGEISMTMESQEDGMLDFKAREVKELGRAMDETLDGEAYNELNNNYKTTVGDGNDAMTFGDIRDGIIEVRSGEYSPDTLIMDLNAYGDLLTDSNFNRATSAGDEVVRTGEVGQVAGLNVIIDNRHTIGSGGHGAYLIDTDNYGFELRRTPMATNRYDDPERMADVVQTYTRRAWHTLWSDAAVRIDG